MSGRWSRGLWEDFWNTWFQWSPFGRPKRNTAVPCSSTTYRRVFRRKSPRSGITPPWKRRGKRLPITVSALWHEARHIIQNKSDLFPRKNNFLFFLILSFFAAVIGLTVETLFFVFSNLPSLVASVPLPLHYLFLEAEKKLTQHSRHLRLVGLPLSAVLGCLIQGLEDLETLEYISGLTLDRGAKEPLSLLAECLQFSIGVQQKVWFGVNVITITLNWRVAYVKMHHFITYDLYHLGFCFIFLAALFIWQGIPKPAMHKVLQALEEQRPKWMNTQLQKARQLCSHRWDVKLLEFWPEVNSKCYCNTTILENLSLSFS